MIRLICLDVDGTLVGSSGDVLPIVWAAAAEARARGIRLAICSGRPAFGKARAFAERLDLVAWHVFQNGASVVHLPDGETRSRALPLEALARVIARSRETGRVLELYTDTEYAVESMAPLAREHAALLGVSYAPRPLESLGGIVRAQWVVPSDQVTTIAAEPHDGLTVAESLSPVMPGTSFVNLTAEGVNKGDAVRRVAEAYSIALADTMMVGDSDNDLSALRVVGMPVAMGNAEPAVKAAAHHVVGDVDVGGTVEAFALAMASAS
jgi:Cof subfamily protein (haloacid dehalogenase superfamily)